MHAILNIFISFIEYFCGNTEPKSYDNSYFLYDLETDEINLLYE